MSAQRADKALVESGLVASRTLAQRLIEAGKVEYSSSGLWCQVTKPSQSFDHDVVFRVLEADETRFVSRAGLKLEGALTRADLNVTGLRALDVGQSTGGFTDCLLKYGCAHVTGIDVGHGQLVDALRMDPRVSCIEGLNARELSADLVGEEFDLAVMDVSFISQTLVLPKLVPLIKRGGALVSLVKPQFEVGPDGIGKGGLVKSVELYADVKARINKMLNELDCVVEDYFESSILGGDGNREFFVVARRSA
jgi:23S rRNA (cytidine1920-2'-O)/16S rRNA (cytidine1409-2'-O)-methyltransferase